MPDLPTGTVTFCFTDIEGSTKLWEHHPEAMRQALVRHDALVETYVDQHGGLVVRPRGEGDSRFAVFVRARDAIAAACVLQQAFYSEPWPTPTPLRVRIALHTGEADLRAGDYYGSAVNRCARLRALAHGGQVLLSQTTYALARDELPAEVSLRDLGAHRLKDLQRPEQVFQLLHPVLPADFPLLASLDAVPNNLPQQMTSLIGREREVAEVTQLLATTRLVTCTGPGGVGKTRLTLEVGAAALPLFPQGVWLVELAPLADGALVAETVASVFGLAQSNRPMLSVLTHYLHDRQLLLILDNCEHLVQASAGLAESLLRACAGLHILVTSREALNIAGEVTWPVASLAAEEARQLFVDRARAARPDFSLTEAHARAVAQICTRLDNIPLAIELAAARLRSYSAEQIAARLDDAFHLLTGGSRTALPRQQTLRASIDWSYGLLSDEERTLLRRLSVFAGGWSLEAAEALSEGDVLGLLDQLVSKSLVNMDERTGEPRYRMLEMVRQYAYDNLIKSGEVERVRNAHLDCFLSLAQEAQPMLERTEQGTWLRRLDREHDNFRIALQWAVVGGAIESGLQLGAALWLFWFIRGYLSEGRAHLGGLLAAARERASTSTRAEALDKAGVLARYQGDYDQAYALISESLALYRQLESKQGIANTLANLGFVALYRGDHRLARSLYGESLTINRELENGQGMADSLSHLAMAALYEGDYATARSLNAESLAIWRNLGDRQGIAWALHILGNVLLKQGEATVAHSVFAESLAISRELAFQWGLAWSLEDFARLASLNKQAGRALRLAGAAHALRAAIGLPQPQPEQVELDDSLEAARQILGKEIAMAVWAEGQSLPLEQAMAEIAELALDATKLHESSG